MLPRRIPRTGRRRVGRGRAADRRRSLGLLWLFVILLALLLVQIRNFYGFVLVVGCARSC